MADIKIKAINYTYPEKEKKALNDINISIPQGQFVIVVGESGSGKSTLIRAIAGLVPDFYGGEFDGSVALDKQMLKDIERREMVQKVGMVFQDPESQLVMTNPEEEIAFGLENIEATPSVMKRRIMEVISALSISPYRTDYIPELSGGQKQKVALASVLAMHPEILLLDEPTSQLDPIAGEEILTMIRRLNEENGMTIILTEQKLERCFHFADRIIVMENGEIVNDSTDISEIAKWAVKYNKPFVPPLFTLFAKIGYSKIPINVKEGREILKNEFGIKALKDDHSINKAMLNKEPCVNIKNLWFTYANGKEVLAGINLSIKKASFTVIMGENGCGKTTLLKNLNGLLRAGKGHVSLFGKDTKGESVESLAKIVGYLSQNPNDYLFLPTVEEEINFTMNNLGIKDKDLVDRVLDQLKIREFKTMNPRDLSTGERQKVALASVLVSKPKLLLLDEPTRGLDYEFKKSLGDLLLQLQEEGTTIIMIAHDVEFAAEYANDIVIMDKGQIIEKGPKETMLTNSTFYSPQISRLFHNYRQQIVTLKQGQEVIKSLTLKGE